jgi:cysteine desulfurase
MALDLAGIATSAGSACASGALDPSHVLIAVGYDLDGAQSGLRLTVGWDTTEAEVDRAAEVLAATVKRFTRVPA